ncbi:pyruvate kinase [Lichenicola cladoniae]|uniref:Pyruvate kinase n=1 Tax=Lichenicola cladoniae TaxID=1484109 RepID=A0A6M8HJN3_9PROT|nr:pyruvate kinase [Lichenicola cladoniae]NPD68525.1 pyruvate kinase [Acetobacteraceae bacterium]QKE88988.1 pyruvate kinase [Lichenicola cladoniae]
MSLLSRRTKIVATLGPVSSSEERIAALAEAGADLFRINFSHGLHSEHGARIAAVRAVEQSRGRPIGILADVQGPKLRVGLFEGGRAPLVPGDDFILDLDSAVGTSRRVQLPHPEIIQAATVGSFLLLDDGRLRLRVSKCFPDRLVTEIVTGGFLSDRKGVNVPDVVLPIPALTLKDRADLEFALQHGVDFIGLSFVQTPADVEEARSLIQGRAWIMTKVEKPQALDNLDAILRLSDAVMVARGDLGVELPPERVPLEQKRIVREARLLGLPVVVATQMLESMISAPAPTRAEASDVATAVFDGADAVMLSGETAVGQYPVEAVSIMKRIVAQVEADASWQALQKTTRPAPENSTSDAIAFAAQQVAETIGAAAIVAYTLSGRSAVRISRERPACPVLGIAGNVAAARRLSVAWGVQAMALDQSEPNETIEHVVESAVDMAKQAGVAGVGDLLVIVAGVPFGRAGTTNTLRVVKVGA